MIALVFSIDYEIYGDGSGDLQKHVIDPTKEFIKILEQHNGKATIFAEVAEFMTMKEVDHYKNGIEKVEDQLRIAHENGHDVQLHVHSWWKDAKYRSGKWILNYENSSLGNLPLENISEFLKNCRDYLNKVLSNCSRPYECRAFRAGSWAIVPSHNMIKALTGLGIRVDSSVFKWGKLDTKYAKFDFKGAYSNIFPWFIDMDDINKMDEHKKNNRYWCLEVPIYAELKRVFTFFTLKRLLMRNKVKSAVSNEDSERSNKNMQDITNYVKNVLEKRAKKFDFCKCNYREMKGMVDNIAKYNDKNGYFPVVAIGHSKDFIDKKDFIRLLKYIHDEYKNTIEIISLNEATNKYLKKLATG